MGGYYLLAGLIFLVSMYVSNRLKSKFKKYSKIQLKNGMSGKEIAEKMLSDNRITDVKVLSVKGQLTDHYNPVNKTVNLSEAVYAQRNAAAAAVANCIAAELHSGSFFVPAFGSAPLLGVRAVLSPARAFASPSSFLRGRCGPAGPCGACADLGATVCVAFQK